MKLTKTEWFILTLVNTKMRIVSPGRNSKCYCSVVEKCDYLFRKFAVNRRHSNNNGVVLCCFHSKKKKQKHSVPSGKHFHLRGSFGFDLQGF